MKTMMTVSGDKELDRFFRKIPAKLKRGAIRKSVAAGAQKLVVEVRNNVKSMVGTREAGVAIKNRKKKPLHKTITKKAWSKPAKGLIGSVVGARYPEGAHAHLVERGHRIVTRKAYGHYDTGKRARPIPFQRKAEVSASPKVLAAKRHKMAVELKKLKAKGLY